MRKSIRLVTMNALKWDGHDIEEDEGAHYVSEIYMTFSKQFA